MSLLIRPGVSADVPLILQFIRELAEYEREANAVVATEARLQRDGFGAAPLFFVRIAEWDGEAAGFALYFLNYSTWRGAPTLYVEDLFVRPVHRGKKIGGALMRDLAREAVRRGCERFAWQVLDWNHPAIDFYESLGAKVLREWLAVRIDGDALSALAARPAMAGSE